MLLDWLFNREKAAERAIEAFNRIQQESIQNLPTDKVLAWHNRYEAAKARVRKYIDTKIVKEFREERTTLVMEPRTTMSGHWSLGFDNTETEEQARIVEEAVDKTIGQLVFKIENASPMSLDREELYGQLPALLRDSAEQFLGEVRGHDLIAPSDNIHPQLVASAFRVLTSYARRILIAEKRQQAVVMTFDKLTEAAAQMLSRRAAYSLDYVNDPSSEADWEEKLGPSGFLVQLALNLCFSRTTLR